ncbi:MAG: ferritin-like domain-containing protein [Candidatus Binatia bacterium]
MRTRDLLHLENTGHPGINALFSKAHSAGWDIDRDLDWLQTIAPDDPLVDYSWAAFGETPTFLALPEATKTYATRRALGRMINILQVGESVAQDVCAKISLCVREEDYRNHAAAQAMDEARHHLAYRRLLEKMGEAPEDIDLGTEMMFDTLLAADAPLELIATEQFFLESVAMDIFESIRSHARHPLVRELLTLVTRDESRHMGFGILYVAEFMKRSSFEARLQFARRWLGQILFAATDQPGPLMLRRLVHRLQEGGVDNADALAPQLLREQEEVNARARAAAIAGHRLPQVMKSARRAGLLESDLLEALGLREHPLVASALATAA